MELNLRENSIKQPIRRSLTYSMSALTTPLKNDSSMDLSPRAMAPNEKIAAPEAPMSNSLSERTTNPTAITIAKVLAASH